MTNWTDEQVEAAASYDLAANLRLIAKERFFGGQKEGDVLIAAASVLERVAAISPPTAEGRGGSG